MNVKLGIILEKRLNVLLVDKDNVERSFLEPQGDKQNLCTP